MRYFLEVKCTVPNTGPWNLLQKHDGWRVENLLVNRGEIVSRAQVKTGLRCFHYTLPLSFDKKSCHNIHGHFTASFIFRAFVLKVNMYFSKFLSHDPDKAKDFVLRPYEWEIKTDLTFRGPRIISIFQYISNNLQLYTVYWYLEIVLRVSGGISTHHQEHTQLYLQHLVLVKPLLLPAAIAAGSSNVLTSTRCCRYSCVCSWWWVEIPPETRRTISRYQ